MKEWIIGDPYTTETELNEKDDFMILACDGVKNNFFLALTYFGLISYGMCVQIKLLWI